MPDPTIDELLRMIYQPAGGAGDENSMLGAALEAQAANTPAAAATTSSSTSSTAASQSSSGSSGTVTSLLGMVLGGLPLVSGLLSLFGGGSSDSALPAPLTKYAAPPSVSVDAGLFQGGTAIGQVDSFADGTPRAIGSSGGAGAASTQVTVQVQAIDSQSFLDHSDEIAEAVRQALLNSHPLGDMVGQG